MATSMSQSEAIRKAIGEIGPQATFDEIRKKLTGWGVKTTPSFDTAVSKQRRRLGVQAKTRHHSTQSGSPDTAPTSQTAAIREAMKEIGPDASFEDIRKKLEIWGITITPSFGSLVSNQRRLLGRKKKPKQDWVEAVRLLRELLQQYGRDPLLEVIDRIHQVMKIVDRWDDLPDLIEVLSAEPNGAKGRRGTNGG